MITTELIQPLRSGRITTSRREPIKVQAAKTPPSQSPTALLTLTAGRPFVQPEINSPLLEPTAICFVDQFYQKLKPNQVYLIIGKLAELGSPRNEFTPIYD